MVYLYTNALLQMLALHRVETAAIIIMLIIWMIDIIMIFLELVSVRCYD